MYARPLVSLPPVGTDVPPDGMNALQHIPESTYGPVLVTLNPPFAPDPATVQGRYRYDHPVLDAQVGTSPPSRMTHS